ncbi:unnamed protein product [Miscanthus lutarioriparius]|uniref:YABBY2 n=1 Tax=Miscanthus lutarioriparius TaxID=422564 RepID=A0A811NFE9_9POAL|nr:unnamed protein product [Miscanthus lutarioriparius]
MLTYISLSLSLCISLPDEIMLVPSEEEDRCRHAIVKLAAASPGGSEVNVPNSCSHNIVTVKCGHCTMVLSMDLSPFHQQARTVPDNQVVQNRGFQYNNFGSYEQASSRNLRTPSMYPVSNNQPQVPPIRPPEKRQRVPSAYNRFIK